MTGPQGAGCLRPTFDAIGAGNSAYDNAVLDLNPIWYSKLDTENADVEWLGFTELHDLDAADEPAGYGGLDYLDAWWSDTGAHPIYDVMITLVSDPGDLV